MAGQVGTFLPVHLDQQGLTFCAPLVQDAPPVRRAKQDCAAHLSTVFFSAPPMSPLPSTERTCVPAPNEENPLAVLAAAAGLGLFAGAWFLVPGAQRR